MAQYTDEQKTEAVALYGTEGMAAAHKATGCPKPSIKRWADEAGVTAPERSAEQTEAATAAHVEQMRTKKQTLRTTLADQALAMLARMDDEEVDWKGNQAKQVTLDKASAASCRNFATSAAILIDKLEIVGWWDGDSAAERAHDDLERLREEARARGEHLTAVA